MSRIDVLSHRTAEVNVGSNVKTAAAWLLLWWIDRHVYIHNVQRRKVAVSLNWKLSVFLFHLTCSDPDVDCVLQQISSRTNL